MGAGVQAREEFQKFLLEFGRHEVEIETYFDQYMMGMILAPAFDKLEDKATDAENTDAAAH